MPHLIGDHAEDERSRIVAEMLRVNSLSYISGLGPLLLRYVLHYVSVV